MKAKSKKTLDKNALADWGLAVRKRDKVCRLCKVRPTANAHHIIGRVHKATRLHLPNGLGLCYMCHEYVGALSKADWTNPWGRTDMYSKVILGTIGEELYNELVALGKTRVKYNEKFIIAAHEEIKKCVE